MAAKRPGCVRVAEYIGCGYTVAGAALNGIAEIHDSGKWGKKAILYVTLYVTLTSLKWAFEYSAGQGSRPGLDTAAVIGAVMAPIAALQSAVVAFYLRESTDSQRIAAGQDSGGGNVTITNKSA